MREKVVIVDYGTGNLRSVARAVAQCGQEPLLTSDIQEIDRASRVILPGVGAFASCVDALRAHGLVEAVSRAMEDGRPVLGICVGMQMLLDGSEELGITEGLGRIPGWVKGIPDRGADSQPHRIPHMGWAELRPAGAAWEGTILEGVVSGSACYFAHSFVAHPAQAANRLAVCDYNGLTLCAAVRLNNLYGVQFHPEKSGPVGLRILANFLRLPATPV